MERVTLSPDERIVYARLPPEVVKAAAKIQLYRRDFRRFCREQLKIKPKLGGPVSPFTLNPPQEIVDREIQRQLAERGFVRLVVLKCRQPGLSTYTQARTFHWTALNQLVNSLMIAQDDHTAQHVFSLTKLFYDSMGEDIRPVYRYSSKRELAFENPDPKTRAQYPGLRSKISFQTARNIHSGTGQMVNILHLTEASKYGTTAETVYSSLSPAVPLAPGTSVIIESTAFVGGDWFHDFCDRVREGHKDEIYRFVFLPWFLSPEYRIKLAPGERLKLDVTERHLVKEYSLTHEQLKFRRVKIQEGGGDSIAEALFDQEFPHSYESAWISTDLSVFDQRKLYEQKGNVCAPKRTCDIMRGPGGGPMMTDNAHGPLWIWEEPVRGELYDIGVDVATGTQDGDWSVAEVIKRSTREQVAEYRRQISPIDYAEDLHLLGLYYNTGQIGCEINGIGFATNDHLNRKGYPYLYIWRGRGDVVPRLSKFSGWKTQTDSAKLMVSLTRHLLMHDLLTIRSVVLWNELRRFAVHSTQTGENYRASEGHDDCVFAFGIALVIADDESYGITKAINHGGPPEGGPRRLVIRDPALCEDLEDDSRPQTGFERLSRALRGTR